MVAQQLHLSQHLAQPYSGYRVIHMWFCWAVLYVQKEQEENKKQRRKEPKKLPRIIHKLSCCRSLVLLERHKHQQVALTKHK